MRQAEERQRRKKGFVRDLAHTIAKYLSLYLHIFTCTYRSTHTQAHMYNQHTRGMATAGHRNLVERGGRKALLVTLHKQKECQKKPKFTNLKKRFEHIELPAKLLNYSNWRPLRSCENGLDRFAK